MLSTVQRPVSESSTRLWIVNKLELACVLIILVIQILVLFRILIIIHRYRADHKSPRISSSLSGLHQIPSY